MMYRIGLAGCAGTGAARGMTYRLVDFMLPKKVLLQACRSSAVRLTKRSEERLASFMEKERRNGR